MRRKCRNHAASFKAKVALAAVRGEKTLAELAEQWDAEVARIYNLQHGPLPSQGEVIGAVNEISGERGVVVCAAGSLPGDLHKLWRTRDPKGYHLEYGYSSMGYEIARGSASRWPTRSARFMSWSAMGRT